MTPIGRGQRELIIGDRKTGKTTVAIDTILNQKGQGVKCIYVAIGQKGSTVAQTVETLREYGAMEYTVVVTAPASDPAPFKYLAPYAGCAMGQHWMENGEHALIVYDDLSKQAEAYRQMSLLLRRPPGREAYPGDVFYLHSRLLERAAKLSDEQRRRLADRPADHRDQGRRRVGLHPDQRDLDHRRPDLPAGRPVQVRRAARRRRGHLGVPRRWRRPDQGHEARWSGTLKLDLAQFRELEAFATFGSELDAVSKAQLERGYRLVELLKQPLNSPMPVEEQVVSIFAGTNGYLDDLPVGDVRRFEAELLESFRTRVPRPARPHPHREDAARRARRRGRRRSRPASRRPAADARRRSIPRTGRRRRASTTPRPTRRWRRSDGVGMAGGQERILRRRIRSVQATKKITRAMELIAASRIVRAQQRVHAAAPYSDQITEVVQDLAAAGGEVQSPLLQRPARDPPGLLRRDRRRPRPVRRLQRRRHPRRRGRDQGRRRCGGVELLARRSSAGRPRATSASAATTSTRSSPASPRQPDLRGCPGASASRVVDAVPGRRGRPGASSSTPASSRPASRRSCSGRSCRSSASCSAAATPSRRPTAAPAPTTSSSRRPATILEALLPRYVEARVYAALLNAAASEQAARQRAMKAATDNAEELIKSLHAGHEPGPPGHHHHRDHGDRRRRRGPVRRQRATTTTPSPRPTTSSAHGVLAP